MTGEESEFRRALAETAEAAGIPVPDGVVPEEESQPSTELVVLPTGQIINLDDPVSCAEALAACREIEQHVRSVKEACVNALAEEAKRRGENVYELPGGQRVAVKRNYDVEWDHVGLEADLRAAGMPEDRIREIIEEEVSYKVKAVEANKAAKANPEYAEAIARARSEVDKRPSISLPRG